MSLAASPDTIETLRPPPGAWPTIEDLVPPYRAQLSPRMTAEQADRETWIPGACEVAS